MATDGITIIGVPELQAKLTPALAAGPARKFLSRWASFTLSKAREGAPVDRGNLRANIDSEIVEGPAFPEYAAVGTNVEYAPYMEGGTGRLADLPGGKGGAHYPPVGPIEAWASRVGRPGQGAAIARAIGRRGGLVPRRFLRNAADASLAVIDRYAAQMASDIEDAAAQ